MPTGRPGWCRKGLHDLSDPANVMYHKNGQGRRCRCCKPCHYARKRAYMAQWRRARRIGLRGGPPANGVEALQLVADGLTYAEAADALGLPMKCLHDRLYRARKWYGVTSTAAAVYAALMRRDIRSVLRTEHPMPPCTNTTRDHARSVARLLRGERLPSNKPRAPEYVQLLDDLYAFSEPHAVSVLWAARMLTRDGTPHWTPPKEKDMDRADHAAAA